MFLDELTEFSRAALEQLREPLETGVVNISRASQQVEYPADFLLVAACNPCKCGYHGDGTDRCQCSASSIESYRNKLSGPLLDRIDMHVYLQRLSAPELNRSDPESPSSGQVMTRVSACQRTQLDRQAKLNCDLGNSELAEICRLEPEVSAFFERACERLLFSARSFHRALRLARTIADLDASPQIQQHHIAEALSLKQW